METSGGDNSRFRFRGVNEAIWAGGGKALKGYPALSVVGVMVSLLTVGVIGSFLKSKRLRVVDAVDAMWRAVGVISFGGIGTGSSARGRMTERADWKKVHTFYFRRSQFLGSRRLQGMLQRGDKRTSGWGSSLLLWD